MGQMHRRDNTHHPPPITHYSYPSSHTTRPTNFTECVHRHSLGVIGIIIDVIDQTRVHGRRWKCRDLLQPLLEPRAHYSILVNGRFLFTRDRYTTGPCLEPAKPADRLDRAVNLVRLRKQHRRILAARRSYGNEVRASDSRPGIDTVDPTTLSVEYLNISTYRLHWFGPIPPGASVIARLPACTIREGALCVRPPCMRPRITVTPS